MKFLRKNFLLLFIFFLPAICSAQHDSSSVSHGKPKPPLSDRIFVGGNLALTFGSVTYIGVAPVVGYMLTPKWMAGVGASYYYFKDNYYHYESSIYGGLLMTRYVLFKGLFVEGDFEENNQDALTIVDPILQTYTLSRKWIPSLLLGAGYSSSMGRNSAFYLSVLYDVIQNPNSQYYGIPVIRAGFGFGL